MRGGNFEMFAMTLIELVKVIIRKISLWCFYVKMINTEVTLVFLKHEMLDSCILTCTDIFPCPRSQTEGHSLLQYLISRKN